MHRAWLRVIVVRQSTVVGSIARRTGARLRAGFWKVVVQLQSPVRGPRDATHRGWSLQALFAQGGQGPSSPSGSSGVEDERRLETSRHEGLWDGRFPR
eukprot:scaffold1558_cov356-Pavlova_lutheri.AAC.2